MTDIREYLNDMKVLAHRSGTNREILILKAPRDFVSILRTLSTVREVVDLSGKTHVFRFVLPVTDGLVRLESTVRPGNKEILGTQLSWRERVVSPHIVKNALYFTVNLDIRFSNVSRKPAHFTDLDVVSYHGKGEEKGVVQVTEITHMQTQTKYIIEKLKRHSKVMDWFLQYFNNNFQYALILTGPRFTYPHTASLIRRVTKHLKKFKVPTYLELFAI